MKAFWRYTLARLSILAVTFLVIWGVYQFFWTVDEAAFLFMLLAAMIVSALISAVVLAGMRQDLAANVQARAERMSSRIEESRSAEDVD